MGIEIFGIDISPLRVALNVALLSLTWPLFYVLGLMHGKRDKR